MDFGKASTLMTTYGVPILLAIQVYLEANPGYLAQYVDPLTGVIIMAILGILIFNYKNPRVNEEIPDEIEAPEQEGA